MKTQKRIDMLNVMAYNELDAQKTRILLYLAEKTEASAMEMAEEFHTDPTNINLRIKRMSKHKYIKVSANKLTGWKGKKVSQYTLRSAGVEMCKTLLNL